MTVSGWPSRAPGPAPLPAPPCPPDANKHGDKETEVPDIDNISRKPRDICCVLLFLVAWLGWIIVAAMAMTDGCPGACSQRAPRPALARRVRTLLEATNQQRAHALAMDAMPAAACVRRRGGAPRARVGWPVLSDAHCGRADNCNDPNKLIYGYDSMGCMCGKDCTKDGGPNNEGRKRLYIPDPRDPALRLCLESCPKEFAFNKTASVQTGVYLCPKDVCSSALSQQQKVNKEKMFYLERNRGSQVTAQGKLDNCFAPTANSTDCWYPTYPTSDVVFKCIPSLPVNLTDDQKRMLTEAGLPIGGADFGSALGPLSNPAGEIGVWASELNQTAWLLGVAFALAMIMGFIFLLLIRLFAVPIVWTAMVGLFVMSILSTLLLWDRAGVIPLTATMDEKIGSNMTALAAAAGEDVAGDASADTTLVTTAATIMTIFTVVYVVLFVMMFKRIMIAVKVVVEACKALAAMPFLVLQPVCTMVSLAILYVWTAIVTLYFMSAGEFDVTTGQFVYSGGDCSGDLQRAPMSPINYTVTAAVLTLTFSSGRMLKRGEMSLDSGATWAAAGLATQVSAYPDLFLNHTDLKGTGCTQNEATLVDKCTGNVNTSSSESLAIGSCLGLLSVDSDGLQQCEKDKITARNVSGRAEKNDQLNPGTIYWNAREGSIRMWVAPDYSSLPGGMADPTGQAPIVTPTLSGTVKLALPITRCSDDGTCLRWDISGQLMRGEDVVGAWSLKTEDIYSAYNITFAEASRACNMVSGNSNKALAKFKASRVLALQKQGKSDLNEVEIKYEFKNITVDNWKSFLPVTLDGSTYNYFVLYHLFMFLWTQNFTISSAYFVTVGAVAAWYWKLDKKDVSAPIRKSYTRYVLFHVGTVCFGSLIIAIVQMIRILMNYYINQVCATRAHTHTRTHTLTHTHTHTQPGLPPPCAAPASPIYVCVCVYVCVCMRTPIGVDGRRGRVNVWVLLSLSLSLSLLPILLSLLLSL